MIKTERYQTSVPEWDRQFRLVGAHDEHREELGRLRLAGIAGDVRQLVLVDELTPLTWEKLAEIGTRIVRHGRDVVFRLAASPRDDISSAYGGW